ncbi:MAG: serine hydrolase, partial [Ferruginibacter sp.]|nr:serine hydrolase [Ferruginibacter sp.]
PGHGDVSVDSHYDLPVIKKSLPQLDSLELYPFREIFKAGIGSVMMAHLFIPAVDSTQNRATSISPNAVKKLMRSDIGYNGLTFTDALEMQGVKKYFPNGEASAQSLIAGNDMLCLPGDVALSIEKIKEAIRDKKLSWQDIELHCKRVLMAKYQYGVSHFTPINTTNITADLNKDIPAMKKLVAENALTILRKENTELFNLTSDAKNSSPDIAYVGIGLSTDNAFAKKMRTDYNAGVFLFNYKQDAGRILSIIELIKTKFKKVVIGIHGFNRTPANNFGISKIAIELVKQIQEQCNCVTLVFGNPYAIKNFCGAKNLVACYEDDPYTQQAAIDLLQGKITAKGKLPVTVCTEYKFGSGIVASDLLLPKVKAEEVGLSEEKLSAIDAVANNAIAQGATPGCVVLVVKNGKIAYEKAFGHYNYDNKELVTTESVYDMASVTKICATTLAVMKLYEEGKIDLKKTLGDYLPWTKGTNKAPLVLEKILLHQAGLVPYIPFNKETIDAAGNPIATYYNTQKSDSFGVKVAENLFMRNSWKDTMYQRILQSPLTAINKYVYSDNDFIFLAKVVEAVSGLPLDEYVKNEFYTPLQLTSTGFKPREHLPLNRIAPSENEPIFRKQLLRGNVHDPGSAMFGSVAGHAGLFSDAYDIAIIMQMLLNGGYFNGKQYLNKETIDYFTAYHSNISRRGFGFDKPEKDNATRPEPYPSISVSPLTFGHTGFTGTCAWADPAHNLTFVFLSNRVTPEGGSNTKLYKLNVRTTIQEIIYEALIK